MNKFGLFLALVGSAAWMAFFLPMVAIVPLIAAAAVLFGPDILHRLSPDAGGNGHGHDLGHSPKMSVGHLLSILATMFTFGLAWSTRAVHRRVEDAVKWLTAMFLAAMCGLSSLVSMILAPSTRSGHSADLVPSPS